MVLQAFMNPITNIQSAFDSYVLSHFPSITDLQQARLTVQTDPAKSFGDLTTTLPLVLSKQVKRAPREIAADIIAQFKHPLIEKIEVAGPGFLNISLTNQAFIELGTQIIEQGALFFKQELPLNKKINIEFVSANPTGPLHFGHGRGAIIGDVLGAVFSFLGADVTREFYINDAGLQIERLGNSFKVRCLQALGEDIAIPEDGYHGIYLADLAQNCVIIHGPSLKEKPDSFFAQYAQEHMLENIKDTLRDYKVNFDVWFSERVLHTSDAIERAISLLKSYNVLYEAENALWFKSTQFGDDKDRVIRKSDGQWTYVAADIAYMLNKVERGFKQLIMILGHDHHSYLTRLNCVHQALHITQCPLDIILYQLVTIVEDGQLVQMSKRAGTGVTLKQVIDAVGVDVARFLYLYKKADAQLEFDVQLALKTTDENPVYYVQYAYVRCSSIFNKAEQELGVLELKIKDLEYLSKAEYLLLKKIYSLRSQLSAVANLLQPHLVAYYAVELADVFHKYYSQHRVIDSKNLLQTKARLLIIQAVRDTLGFTFDLMNISRPERM